MNRAERAAAETVFGGFGRFDGGGVVKICVFVFIFWGGG